MKRAIALILLFGVLCTIWARADDAQIAHSRWIIILTVTDLATGTQLEQRELDADLRFDDQGQCEAIVAKVGPLHRSDNFAAVLTCRKIERNEVVL
jgi:hypothetical protein